MENRLEIVYESGRARSSVGAAIVFSLLLGPAFGAQGTEKAAVGRGVLGAELRAEGAQARVLAVLPGGPASKGGLAVGDLIVAFNGTGFRFTSDRQLIEGLEWVRPGRPVRLAVLRQGARRELVLVPRAASAEEKKALDSWLVAQRLEEERKRRDHVEALFEQMVRQKPVEITFRRTATGVVMSSQTLLPPGLDLRNRVLDSLTGALHVNDPMTIRYSWEGARNALKMDVIGSPQYVDLNAVLGSIVGARGQSGKKP